MSKRAVIYIRVSTERQNTRVSPQAQEADCRALIEKLGYTLIEIYSDTERYRSGGRMVEPSGTRGDRPELRRMLSDALAGKFDVLVSWREDRLYRSYRPMLDVLDCIEETGIDIELVKENFDKKIAPVKAWAARLELDARQDRVMMGIAGRLGNGNVWPAAIPYGYRLKKDIPEINPSEAEWVQKIWEWYAAGKPIRQIRQLLIENNAPQRSDGKIPWQIPWIYSLLRNQTYYTGIQSVKWGEHTHEIPYPIIVDADMAQRVKSRKEKSKSFPARNVKHKYLAMGFVFCKACGVRMTSYTGRAYKNGKPTQRLRRYYRCKYYLAGYPNADCPHQAPVLKIDAELWEKLWSSINEDGQLEEAIQKRLDQLNIHKKDIQPELEKMERDLDNLIMERQWVITQARKKVITDNDLEYQLGLLTVQEKQIKQEMMEKSLLVGNRAEKLLEFSRAFREYVQAGSDFLNSIPTTEEAKKRQYLERRKIVEAIVKRVNVHKDKSITLDLVIGSPDQDKDKEAQPWWQ